MKNKAFGDYGTHFPNSIKVYAQGSRPDIRVPFREIQLSPSQQTDGSEIENEPLRVYDTSGRGLIRRRHPAWKTGYPHCARYGSKSAKIPRAQNP